MRKIMILMPAYEDFLSAQRLVRDLEALADLEVSVVIVDDGSVRCPITPDVFSRLPNSHHVLSLARNVGHQAAIAAGLTYLAQSKTHYDAVVVMDSDGEDDPSCVPEIIAKLLGSDADVVVAQRGRRSEGLIFRLFYKIYRLLFLTFTGKKISFGNFMALRPSAVAKIVNYNSLWTHFAATVVAARLRVDGFTVDRTARYFGESKMSFFSLCLHGFRALMVFADDVLVRVGVASAAIALIAFMLSVMAGVLKLLGVATPGWFSIAIGILLIVFLQTGALTLISLMLSSKSKADYVIPEGTGGLVARVSESNSTSISDLLSSNVRKT